MALCGINAIESKDGKAQFLAKPFITYPIDFPHSLGWILRYPTIA